MISELINFFKILPRQEQRRIYSVQLFIVIISLFEVLTALLLASLVAMFVGDNAFLQSLPVADMSNYFGKDIFILIVLFTLIFGAVLSIWLTHKINIISFDIGNNISVSLFDYFQNLKYKDHLKNNSSDYINMILAESNRLTSGIISPALLMISRMVLVVFSFVLMLLVDFYVTFTVLVIFLCSYLLIFLLSRGILDKNSKDLTYSNANRLRLLNEVFKGIMLVIMSGEQNSFREKYEKVSKIGARAQASNSTLASAPRYVVEVLVYVVIFFLISYYLSSGNLSIGELFPLLSLVGVLSLKVLPSLQQVYNFVATIKGNLSVLAILNNPLSASFSNQPCAHSYKSLPLNSNILLDRISYVYDQSTNYSLYETTLTINKFDIVAFVGESGSGKSTIVNIIAGLLEPSGRLLIDGINVSGQLYNWRKNISYVPQEVFIFDGTIAENVVFGSLPSEIDNKKIWRAIKLSGLEDVVKKLPDKIHSHIGEGGGMLSGGQRQRLTIARALYSDSEVIIFDEATSALDNITQGIILDTIKGLVGLKTIIIIAHRIEAVKQANIIYMMNKGRIIDSGSFDDLAKNNPDFNKSS